jgi:hypothetical protein
MQNARSASRRTQFQLWIFSYTKLVESSKKTRVKSHVTKVRDFIFRSDSAHIPGYEKVRAD